MAHTITGKKRLLARVRRIQGQARALEGALTGETECVAVLQQIAAIRGAVNGLMAEVLEGHLREHVGAEGLSQEARGRELDQVAGLLHSYLK
jgi:DNA-binding FrmR family transcriptional regulator